MRIFSQRSDLTLDLPEILRAARRFFEATLEVQGILVRGNNDYAKGTAANGPCTRANVCSEATGCVGGVAPFEGVRNGLFLGRLLASSIK